MNKNIKLVLLVFLIAKMVWASESKDTTSEQGQAVLSTTSAVMSAVGTKESYQSSEKLKKLNSIELYNTTYGLDVWRTSRARLDQSLIWRLRPDEGLIVVIADSNPDEVKRKGVAQAMTELHNAGIQLDKRTLKGFNLVDLARVVVGAENRFSRDHRQLSDAKNRLKAAEEATPALGGTRTLQLRVVNPETSQYHLNLLNNETQLLNLKKMSASDFQSMQRHIRNTKVGFITAVVSSSVSISSVGKLLDSSLESGLDELNDSAIEN